MIPSTEESVNLRRRNAMTMVISFNGMGRTGKSGMLTVTVDKEGSPSLGEVFGQLERVLVVLRLAVHTQ
jgi:hypothetical protein